MADSIAIDCRIGEARHGNRRGDGSGQHAPLCIGETDWLDGSNGDEACRKIVKRCIQLPKLAPEGKTIIR